MPAMPPPPPPPPPPGQDPADDGVKPEARGGSVVDHKDPITHYMGVGQTGLHRYREGYRGDNGGGKEGRVIYLSFYQDVRPIIQSGPVCGLVALAMAAPLVGIEGVTTATLLDRAIAKGYSRQGEMFSAVNMSCLAQWMLPAPYCSELVDGCSEATVVSCLLRGELLLVPYDADKNHSPCLMHGHKAHWMLLTGCFLAVDNRETLIDPSLLENEDYYERDLFHLKPERPSTWRVLSAVGRQRGQLLGALVFGQQGKSRHTGVWTLSQLLDSNAQLSQLGPERAGQDLVLPLGGVEGGLRGKAVRIFKSDPS